MKHRLFIFSGLPGSGKSTIGKALASLWKAAYIRIDTIEQGIRDLYDFQVEEQGYELAFRIVAENLKAEINVIADSCNPIETTRNAWEKIALENGALFTNIEIVCSNMEEHRRRVETRISEIDGLKLPTWNEVVNREYQPWVMERITIDTANKTVEACMDELNEKLRIEIGKNRNV